jgi:hypothetical protein
MLPLLLRGEYWLMTFGGININMRTKKEGNLKKKKEKEER